MKYLKQIFENTQSDVKLKKTIDDYSRLIKLTKEYLTNYCELENDTDIMVIEDMWYANPEHYINKKAFPKMPVFCINYLTVDNDEDTHTLYQKDYEDFLLYLDDPDLYKSTKKYNL